MNMNKTLAITILLGVTIMMMGSILPVMADSPGPEGDHADHPDDCASGLDKAAAKSGKSISTPIAACG